MLHSANRPHIDDDDDLCFEEGSANVDTTRRTRLRNDSSDSVRVDAKSPSTSSTSAHYLAISLEPSAPLPVPSALRKLLILDLNGTLLVRSAVRSKRRAFRKVHLRPYLRPFLDYVFHSDTSQWLDTMVWSSAQPHSVEDMVYQCFGSRKERLVAVWSRDKMGLSKADYHRYSPTTKDLRKPWAELANHTLPYTAGNDESSICSSQSPSPTSRPASPPGTVVERWTETHVHSAYTTLLLDDSLLKATLQPYNHLCVREYDGNARADDLKACQSQSRAAFEYESEDGDWEERYQRRIGERERPLSSQQRNKREPAQETPENGYDQTLLAVIGILDALKLENNVASWMRAGGLWMRGALPVAKPGSHYKLEHVSALSYADESKGEKDQIGANANVKAKKQKQRHAAPDGADDKPFLESTTNCPGSSSSASAPANNDAMWFTHTPTLRTWVRRGLDALSALGIDAGPGLEM